MELGKNPYARDLWLLQSPAVGGSTLAEQGASR